MENASKALIIAGAILLAILLISLGILVYNNARGTITDANLDAETAQAFNTRISQYCGNRKSATDMNSLIDAIAASNGSQTSVAQNNRHVVSVEVKAASGSSSITDYYTGSATVTLSAASPTPATGTQYPNFSAGATYSATYETGTDGYINKVIITIATT